ncbi:unnamed protein product [Ceratitis capitata]|uniref:(Mediterranean fruit fly) hypothetical protein n=1 Tax=Ceratitis capitata TaxID=7213 RepID=A0A811V5R6_CERCA|nr:unnamed protein product [Ceratitis capitata]
MCFDDLSGIQAVESVNEIGQMKAEDNWLAGKGINRFQYKKKCLRFSLFLPATQSNNNQMRTTNCRDESARSKWNI